MQIILAYIAIVATKVVALMHTFKIYYLVMKSL